MSRSSAGLAPLAERANRELSRWGHADHEVTLERMVPFVGDPSKLRCTFWCETCHVSQVALLSRPSPSEVPKQETEANP